MQCRWLTILSLTIVAVSSPAYADNVEVQVGYADNIRPSPFFPTPWCGDAGVTFKGSSCGSSFDTGAIRIISTSAAGFNIDSVTVTGIPWVTFSGQPLWGPFLVTGLGNSAILAQTTEYNFDTSDDQAAGGNNGTMASITIDFHDGTSLVLVDTGQVLNTNGSDSLGASDENESFRWRDVGGNGTQGGGTRAVTPEPSSWILLGTGALGALSGLSRRLRAH